MYRQLSVMITELVLGLLVFYNWLSPLTVESAQLYVPLPASFHCGQLSRSTGPTRQHHSFIGLELPV